jgi:DNA-binding response OmpR family regulator
MPSHAAIDKPALCVLFAEADLSFTAKGILALLLSRPPRVITRAELFRSSRDGMPMIDHAIQELVVAGLVSTVPPRRRGDRASGGVKLRWV